MSRLIVEHATSKIPDSRGRFLLREFNGYLFPREINEKLLQESQKRRMKAYNSLILAGVLQRAEIQNQNGRIYSKNLLQREVESYWDLIKQGRATGECDHPDRSIVEFKGISHRVIDLWWEGNDLLGKIEILTKFPAAQYLVAAYEHNVPIGLSSRGLGSVTESSNGKILVNDDFQIICWDAVVDPSTHEAFMNITISEGNFVGPQWMKELDSRQKTNKLIQDILGRNK